MRRRCACGPFFSHDARGEKDERRMPNMKTLATVLMFREGHGVDAHRNLRCPVVNFSLLHCHAAVEAGRLHGRSIPRAWWCPPRQIDLCTCSDDAVGWCVEGERLVRCTLSARFHAMLLMRAMVLLVRKWRVRRNLSLQLSL